LEVLPYVLSALIAAVVVPGFLYSQAYGTKAAVMPNVPDRGENVLEMIRQDHGAFAPRPHVVGLRRGVRHAVTKLVSLHSVAGVDSKKADGRIRLVSARTTLHARAKPEVA
jgi:hypothetical protein